MPRQSGLSCIQMFALCSGLCNGEKAVTRYQRQYLFHLILLTSRLNLINLSWSQMSFNILFFLFINYLAYHAAAQNTGTFTLGSEAGYKNLRQCAQDCLGGVVGPTNIFPFFSCESPWYNNCYCGYGRSDLESLGTSFLSSCISSSCTQGNPGPDASSANVVYESYCAQNGFTFPAGGQGSAFTTTIANPIATTIFTGTTPAQVVSTVTKIIAVTGTSDAGFSRGRGMQFTTDNLVFAVIGQAMLLTLKLYL
jgi:hypothetical protein